MKSLKMWTFGRPQMWTFYIFEPLKTHSYEPDISLIRLMLIMQNPDQFNTSLCPDFVKLHNNINLMYSRLPQRNTKVQN